MPRFAAQGVPDENFNNGGWATPLSTMREAYPS